MAVKLKGAGYPQPGIGRFHHCAYPDGRRDNFYAPTADQIGEIGGFSAGDMTADEAAEKWIQEKSTQNG